jgi:hypothetical protein
MIFSVRPIVGLWALTAAALLSTSNAFADQPFSASPLGPQKVLVLPIEFPVGDACPNKNETCPAGLQAFYSANIAPPRHTAQEWEQLLNSVTSTWWQQTTYGQTSFEFTVLSNPQSADGWWPPPHSFQDYSRNNGNWYQSANNPASYAFVPDATAGVVQSICGNPLLFVVCDILPQYNRLIVMSNVHTFGDQSLGNDSPFTIPTGTSLNNLVVSASWANEDTSDSGITSLMHELGHQSGELSHYGDCSAYFTYTSFNSVLPTGPVECITGWDIMGRSYSFSEFSGYSKVSRGWIDAGSTPSFDLIGGGAFAETFVLNPLELAPTASNPDVIRLSIGDLSWPTFAGYFVECREPVGGDVAAPFPSIPVGTIPDQGILITNVHEYSLSDIPGAPAHHVERALLPSDTLGTATLKPGQEFSDPLLGLAVRFNGYTGTALAGGIPQCSVSVASNAPLPPLNRRIIRFAGSVELNPRIHALDTASISSDIALNGVLAASPHVDSIVPLAAPWPGHANPVVVRVHNRSTGPIDQVTVAVDLRYPAVISDACGSVTPGMPAMGMAGMMAGRSDGARGMDTGTVAEDMSLGGATGKNMWPQVAVVRDIAAASSAVTALEWTPRSDQSVSLDATAIGPANQIHTSSRFAFQFHDPQNRGREIRSQFKVASSAHCMTPQTYYIGPAASVPGWSVDVFPSTVTLQPGAEADVTVAVTPPEGAKPGQSARIPIVVHAPMQMLPDASLIAANTPPNFTPGVHYMSIGAMTVLARVTAGPGSVSLGCRNAENGADGAEHPNCDYRVSDHLTIGGNVSPAVLSSSLDIEYRSPDGKATTHVVFTDADGHFVDSLRTHERGAWRIQARWSGGDANNPTESRAILVSVR